MILDLVSRPALLPVIPSVGADELVVLCVAIIVGFVVFQFVLVVEGNTS